MENATEFMERIKKVQEETEAALRKTQEEMKTGEEKKQRNRGKEIGYY